MHRNIEILSFSFHCVVCILCAPLDFRMSTEGLNTTRIAGRREQKCSKCSALRGSDELSCCARGGAWYQQCGDVGNTHFNHTWVEGIRACTSTFPLSSCLTRYTYADGRFSVIVLQTLSRCYDSRASVCVPVRFCLYVRCGCLAICVSHLMPCSHFYSNV